MIRNNILITGASGFIGANLVRKLVRENQKVHIFLRKSSNTWRIKDILPKINSYEINFEDKKLLAKIVKKLQPEFIFHLAAYGGYPFQKDLKTMLKANILNTVNLMESLKDVSYRLFLSIGSSSEYGFKKYPMKETDFIAPESFYAATKAGMTHISYVYSNVYNKPIVTVRPFSVYGPYEETTKLIANAVMACLKNTDLKLTEGSQRRDFIYIDDFIRGLLDFCKFPQKVRGRVINLGTGKQYSIKEIITFIQQLTNCKSKFVWGAYKPRIWDTDYWVSDISLAKNLVGWKPQISLKVGLAKTIDWFKKNTKLYE